MYENLSDPMPVNKEIKLYSGTGNPALAEKIAAEGRVACAKGGNTSRIVRTKSAETVRSSAAYDRLVNMGKRLMEVIRHNQGGANKDLARFTSQIAALCDKWDR